jgi:hypothetical protein
MKLTTAFLVAGFAASLSGQDNEKPPKHEVGLTLGRFISSNRKLSSGSLDLGSGAALQANYALKFLEGHTAALYGEVHFLASPQRLVTSSDRTLTRDVATIFLTPGLRVKFLPRSAVSPYIAAGAGYAVYEQSLNRLDGQPNGAPRTIHRGALNFGAGLDVRFWRFVGFRGEIRDFYSGSPAYNAPSLSGGQHNVVVGGGLVLKFR